MPVVSPARVQSRRFSRRLWGTLAALAVSAVVLAVWLARAQLLAAETDAARLRFAADAGAARALRSARAAELQRRLDFLATRPRLHAALEDDALDLLYPVAFDELGTFLAGRTLATPGVFYRFLDAEGRELAPSGVPAGEMPAGFAAALDAFRPTGGPLWRIWIDPRDPVRAWEVTAAPLQSTETRRPLGALLVAVPSAEPDTAYWVDGRLHAPQLRAAESAALAAAIRLAPPAPDELRAVDLDGAPFLVAFHALDAPASAWEIRRASLAPLRARQAGLTRRILLVGLAGCALAALAVGWISARFGASFGHVALRLDVQRRRRERAETRLELTQEERDRAARFAADASHQLKTPVAVLRAGLDELAAVPAFPAERRGDLADLVRQTERLGQIVDDLLLLARLDAGLVPATGATADLGALLARALDDASAYPGADRVSFAHQAPRTAHAIGEPRHLALVLQSLLENAVKYSRADTTVTVSLEDSAGEWRVRVANVSTLPIPEWAHERIFERFHRGPSAGAETGHGLGLSLARQLARLHGGEVRLASSTAEATVFEVRLRRAAGA